MALRNRVVALVAPTAFSHSIDGAHTDALLTEFKSKLTARLAGGTGITDNAAGVGSLLVVAASSARFRLVKTGTAAWNLYRVG